MYVVFHCKAEFFSLTDNLCTILDFVKTGKEWYKMGKKKDFPKKAGLILLNKNNTINGTTLCI